MPAVSDLATTVGIGPACAALNVPRASYYRWQWRTGPVVEPKPRPRLARALAASEQETVLDFLHQERFQDRSPAAVYATLLDEGHYHCSIRTMYRLLEQRGESREGGIISLIRPARNPNCWPPRPTSSGAGTSPSCSAPPSGLTSIST